MSWRLPTANSATTFPDLSYNPMGIIWSDGPHSFTYSSEWSYLRTDLRTFVHWNDFKTKIHQAITAHMANMNISSSVEFDVGSMLKWPQEVSEEEDVRSKAKVQLHDLVVEVLEILEIEGKFLRSDSGNNQIVGAPDFSWLWNHTLHPKLVVRISLTLIYDIWPPSFWYTVAEYKTRWMAPLADLPGYFRQRNRKRQSIDAVYQLYGYMMFNDNKYGVLNNMKSVWFFNVLREAKPWGTTGWLVSIPQACQVCSRHISAQAINQSLHLILVFTFKMPTS